MQEKEELYKMKIKLILILIFIFTVSLNAVVMPEGEFIKQRYELEKLKKELDEFYNIKEQEYQNNKQSIDKVNLTIQSQLDDIKKIRDENQKILDEIEQKIVSKAMKLYSKMKPKLVKTILQKKIDSGDINEVFDIMVRLKEKRVLLIPNEQYYGDDFQKYRQFRTSIWYEAMRLKHCPMIFVSQLRLESLKA